MRAVRDTLLNIKLVQVRPRCTYVGVNACVNVKMKATAVPTEANFTAKTWMTLQMGLKRYDIIMKTNTDSSICIS